MPRLPAAAGAGARAGAAGLLLLLLLAVLLTAVLSATAAGARAAMRPFSKPSFAAFPSRGALRPLRHQLQQRPAPLAAGAAAAREGPGRWW